MKAQITTDGRKILLKIAYANGHGKVMAKKVPGARAMWDKTGPRDIFVCWTYPLTMDTCRAFRRVFGDDLEVMPPLISWARKKIAEGQKLESFREGESSAAAYQLDRLEEEAPDLFRAMSNRSYQLAGTSFMTYAGQCLLGDDPGLGKTLQILGALIQADAHTILVGCRRTACRTVWERETNRWAPGIWTFVAQGTRTEREHEMQLFSEFPAGGRQRKMLIINIEMIRAKKITICPQGLGEDCPAYKVGECRHHYEPQWQWPFLNRPWDAVILDESHNLLASTANVGSKRITQARYGAVMLRRQVKRDGLALAASGTPARSKLLKFWGTLNWLRPDVFTSFWQWAETHFGTELGRYGRVIQPTIEEPDGAKVPEPLDQAAFDAMLRPYYLRRTKSDAAPDLKPIEYAGTPIDPEDPDSPCYVQLDMEPEQAKAYRSMVMDAEAFVQGGRITATGTLATFTRLRQFASASGKLGAGRTVLPALPSSKLAWLVEFMQEREGSGRKVVVASSFTEMIKLTREVLEKEGFEVMTITGESSDRERSDVVARFQDTNDTCQVVCINRKAGGESITLDAADEMVILEPPWISDDDEQLQARIHRVSRIHNVTVYRLLSAGTVDIWMATSINEQRQALLNAEPKKLSEMLKEML
jgi:SNF2 family DNA or RNA helicase